MANAFCLKHAEMFVEVSGQLCIWPGLFWLVADVLTLRMAYS